MGFGYFERFSGFVWPKPTCHPERQRGIQVLARTTGTAAPASTWIPRWRSG